MVIGKTEVSIFGQTQTGSITVMTENSARISGWPKKETRPWPTRHPRLQRNRTPLCNGFFKRSVETNSRTQTLSRSSSRIRDRAGSEKRAGRSRLGRASLGALVVGRWLRARMAGAVGAITWAQRSSPTLTCELSQERGRQIVEQDKNKLIA